MTFIDKVIIFAATGAWTGKVPIAPGTFGTLTGIIFVLGFKIIHPCYETLYVVALIIFAIWIAGTRQEWAESSTFYNHGSATDFTGAVAALFKLVQRLHNIAKDSVMRLGAGFVTQFLN